ncbi:MAG TPA: glycosyltransferase family 39 protein, partial [Actinotalea sp.]
MAPLVIGVVATVLTAIGSWNVSLWSDEVATLSAAERDVGALERLVERIDAVHGTYYLLMHLWVGWFGASPVAVRLPSALAVGVAAAGVVVLARRLAGPRTALLAGAVFLVLPRVTWAGIEARPFALSIAVAVWMTVVLHSAVTRGGAARYVGYGLLLALGTAVNLYVALVAAAHVVTLLLSRSPRRTVVATVLAAAGGLAAASPVVLAALGQGGHLGRRGLSLLGLARNVIVNQWFLGETPTGTTASGSTLAAGSVWKLAAIALALLCWALVVWATVQ